MTEPDSELNFWIRRAKDLGTTIYDAKLRTYAREAVIWRLHYSLPTDEQKLIYSINQLSAIVATIAMEKQYKPEDFEVVSRFVRRENIEDRSDRVSRGLLAWMSELEES